VWRAIGGITMLAAEVTTAVDVVVDTAGVMAAARVTASWMAVIEDSVAPEMAATSAVEAEDTAVVAILMAVIAILMAVIVAGMEEAVEGITTAVVITMAVAGEVTITAVA